MSSNNMYSKKTVEVDDIENVAVSTIEEAFTGFMKPLSTRRLMMGWHTNDKGKLEADPTRCCSAILFAECDENGEPVLDANSRRIVKAFKLGGNPHAVMKNVGKLFPINNVAKGWGSDLCKVYNTAMDNCAAEVDSIIAAYEKDHKKKLTPEQISKITLDEEFVKKELWMYLDMQYAMAEQVVEYYNGALLGVSIVEKELDDGDKFLTFETISVLD